MLRDRAYKAAAEFSDELVEDMRKLDLRWVNYVPTRQEIYDRTIELIEIVLTNDFGPWTSLSRPHAGYNGISVEGWTGLDHEAHITISYTLKEKYV